MTGLLDSLWTWFEGLGLNVWAQAAIIVVLSLLIAKLADWVLCRLVLLWARRTKTDFDDRLIASLHRPLFVSVVLIGLAAAALRLEMGETPLWLTLAALKTIAVWIWLVFGVRFLTLVLELLGRQEDRFALVQPSTEPLLNAVGRVVLVGGAIYFVMLSWKVDITAWLASAGIIGLALSFAAKDSLANLFAGVFILADAPYKVGDFVILDTGERGVVTKIGMRSTRLLTRDDVEITIPNSVMGNAKIVNESGGPHEKQRIRVQVGVAYGSDIDKVQDVLMAIADGHPELCREPEPRVRFRSFGNSGLDFELLVWIEQPVQRGLILHQLNREVYKAFARDGIEIPYPKHDVYIRQTS